jgi:hypothetical protein
VSNLRKLVISEGGPSSGTGLITALNGSDSGHHEGAFESSTLSSHDWATAKRDEQRRFVGGVGLRALFNAAPQDHREAFTAWLVADLQRTDRPSSLPTDRIEGPASGDDLDIPTCLRRPRSEVG